MRLLLAIALLFGMAMPASAQRYDGELENPDRSQIGSRFKRASETAGEIETRRLQRRVARCVYDRHEELSDKILAHSSFGRIDFTAIEVDPDDLFDALDVDRCIGRAMKHNTYSMHMRIRFSTLRNLLAEEAYLEANDDPLTLDAATPALLTNRYLYDSMSKRDSAIANMSDCLVHADPAGSHAVLAELPGSDGEGEAIEALSGALGKCLGSGASTGVSGSMIRQVLADGLWSRSHFGTDGAAQ